MTPQSIWHSSWRHPVWIQLMKVTIIDSVALVNPFHLLLLLGSYLDYSVYAALFPFLQPLSSKCMPNSTFRLTVGGLAFLVSFSCIIPQLLTSPTSSSGHPVLSTPCSWQMGRPSPANLVLSAHLCQKNTPCLKSQPGPGESWARTKEEGEDESH